MYVCIVLLCMYRLQHCSLLYCLRTVYCGITNERGDKGGEFYTSVLEYRGKVDEKRERERGTEGRDETRRNETRR